MPSGTECVCCSEISQIVNKRSSVGVGCITLHPVFVWIHGFSKQPITAIDNTMAHMLLKALSMSM